MFCILGVNEGNCLVLDTSDKTVECYSIEDILKISKSVKIIGVSGLGIKGLCLDLLSFNEFVSSGVDNLVTYNRGSFCFILLSRKVEEKQGVSLYFYLHDNFVGRQELLIESDSVELSFKVIKDAIRAEVLSFDSEGYFHQNGWILNLKTCRVRKF